MQHWQDNEIKELLTIRASEAIRHQITGTVRDSVVYNRMRKLLAERGIHRTHMQVINKLKALRKQYSKYHQQKIRRGSNRVDWPFYEQCHRAFGNSPPVGNPVKRNRSPAPPPVPSPPAPHPPPSVVVSLWDEVDDREISKHLGPVEADDEEEQYSPPEPPHPIKTSECFSVVVQKTHLVTCRISCREIQGIYLTALDPSVSTFSIKPIQREPMTPEPSGYSINILLVIYLPLNS